MRQGFPPKLVKLFILNNAFHAFSSIAGISKYSLLILSPSPFCSLASPSSSLRSSVLCSSKDLLFISFACPKETNQRKRQPQIFFGFAIFFSCPRNTTRPTPWRGAQTVLLVQPSLQSGCFAKKAHWAFS